MAKSRKLVVYEDGAGEGDRGRMFAIDPKDATGVPLPTMTVGASLPAVGGIVGELFYVSTSHLSWVWDGVGWQSLTPSVISAFATDALLLANTALKVGSYASATDSGNLYVKIPGAGAGGWRQVGIHQYPTTGGLLGDAPAEGSLGFTGDEGTLWAYTGGAWRAISRRIFGDFVTLAAWTPSDGAMGYVVDEGSVWQRIAGAWACINTRLLIDMAALNGWRNVGIGNTAYVIATNGYFVYDGRTWIPVLPYRITEAAMRAVDMMTVITGQVVITTDTGKTFVAADDGAGGLVWVGSPLASYATDALLIAAVAPPGTVAFAQDTGAFYGRVAAPGGDVWVKGSGVTNTILADGAALPAVPTAGDTVTIFKAAPDAGVIAKVQAYSGTAWVDVPAGANTILADGAALPAAPNRGDMATIFKPAPDATEIASIQIYSGAVWVNSPLGVSVTLLLDTAVKPLRSNIGDLLYLTNAAGLITGTEIWNGAAWIRTVPNIVATTATHPATPQKNDISVLTSGLFTRTEYWDGAAWKGLAPSMMVKDDQGDIFGTDPALGYARGVPAQRQPTLYIKTNQAVNGGWFRIDRLWENAYGWINHNHNAGPVDTSVAGVKTFFVTLQVLKGRRYKITFAGNTGKRNAPQANIVTFGIKAKGVWLTGTTGRTAWGKDDFAVNTRTGGAITYAYYDALVNGPVEFAGWTSDLWGDAQIWDMSLDTEDVGPTTRAAMQ
jgi:hypothetical protein